MPVPRYRISRPSIGTTLPVLTSFIGRERELGEVGRLLRGGTRVVTLTGVGGCGKTRLALEVAGQVGEEYPDGVWVVDLSGLSDPLFVARTVGVALGVREGPTDPIETTVVGYLGPLRALLVLDNCEHVVEASAGFVGTVVTRCGGVQVVATSREALRIPGEVVVQVAPLGIPPKGEAGEGVRKYDAVRLFEERARAADGSFALTAGNGGTIGEICRQLDGLPLAIELAATRVRALTPEQIGERLGDRFRILTQGARTAPTRSQTMRASLDWSYETLSPREQPVFRRLAVFAGGWTLDGAEAVCADSPSETSDVVELLLQLIDKSLVVTEERAGSRRYRLLETVRQYAAELMTDPDELFRVRQRHLTWCATYAERLGREPRGPDGSRWLDIFELDKDNFSSALAWSVDNDTRDGMRLANGLGVFWARRGYRTEAIHWLDLLVERSRSARHPHADREFLALRASCLEALRIRLPASNLTDSLRIMLWMSRMDPEAPTAAPIDLVSELKGRHSVDSRVGRAREQLRECLELRREVGDPRGVCNALRELSFVELTRGETDLARDYLRSSLDVARALGDRALIASALAHFSGIHQFDRGSPRILDYLQESRELFEEAGDNFGLARTMVYFGELALSDGRVGEAEAFLSESLRGFQRLGDVPLTMLTEMCIGIVTRAQGDRERSERLFEEVLSHYRTHGYREQIGVILVNLGSFARHNGQLERARDYFLESLEYFRQTDNRPGMALTLCLIGLLMMSMGDLARGARTLGAASTLFGQVRAFLDRDERSDYDLLVGGGEKFSGQPSLQGFHTEGRNMTPELAVAYAVT